MVLCLIFCYNSKNFMGIEDLPVLGKEPDFKPTQEEIQNARQNLGKELPLHLERKMKHRQMKMNNLLEDPAIAINYYRINPDWIKQYFVSRPGFFNGKEGPYRMIAWRILVARLLFIDGCVRDSVQRVNVENALKKIEAHRESPLGRLKFLQGKVLYIAGSSTIQSLKDQLPREHWPNIDKYAKAYGQYQFCVSPVENDFENLFPPDPKTKKKNFDLRRLKNFDDKEENNKQKKDLLNEIKDEKSPLTLVLDGHGDKDHFYFHAGAGGDSFSVDDLVDAFVVRAKRTHHLPIGLMHGEYGQEVVGLHCLDFFRGVLRVDKGGATVGTLMEADEKRMGLNNFVLYVPSMYSPENGSRTVPYDLVDRIIFSQCEGMDFAVSFYRELQRRMGGGQYYLPITRGEKRRGRRETDDEHGIV